MDLFSWAMISIARRVIGFLNMSFAPLVLGILQNLDLIGGQQLLDLKDGRVSVWLETCPDILQLFARHLDLRRVLQYARLPIGLLGSINTGLVGFLVLLARIGEVVLDWLQLGSLRVGEFHLLLEAGWKESAFAYRSVIFQRCLVFHGLDEGEGVGVGILRQQCRRGQYQRTADCEQGEFGLHVVPYVCLIRLRGILAVHISSSLSEFLFMLSTSQRRAARFLQVGILVFNGL